MLSPFLKDCIAIVLIFIGLFKFFLSITSPSQQLYRFQSSTIVDNSICTSRGKSSRSSLMQEECHHNLLSQSLSNLRIRTKNKKLLYQKLSEDHTHGSLNVNLTYSNSFMIYKCRKMIVTELDHSNRAK